MAAESFRYNPFKFSLLILSMFILRANGRRGLGVAFRIIGERRLSFGSFTRLKIPVQSVDVFNKLSVQEM